MYKLSTCDASFVGTLDECKEWFESDDFSPKLTPLSWFKLEKCGSLQCGFPWGVITLEKVN